MPERSKRFETTRQNGSRRREPREPRTWVCTTTPSRARAQSRWRTTSRRGRVRARLSRGTSRRALRRARRCDVGAERGTETESDDGAAARLREPGDAVAVHNPTGWVLPYAEVETAGRATREGRGRSHRARGADAGAKDGRRSVLERAPSLSHADGEEDDEIDGLSETVAALTDGFHRSASCASRRSRSATR